MVLGWLWLGPAVRLRPFTCTLALPSAVIGLLVGAIAGGLGKPGRGALVGFVLSGFVFEVFMCACASVLSAAPGGTEKDAAEFLIEALPYMFLMGAAGAAAGGIGGAAGSAAMRDEEPRAGTQTQ